MSVLLNNWKSVRSSEDPKGRAKPLRPDLNKIIQITIVKLKQMNGGISLGGGEGGDSTLCDRRADGTRGKSSGQMRGALWNDDERLVHQNHRQSGETN